MSSMAPFEQAFAIVVGHEGGFDMTRADPGNWTDGAVGVGVLGGTKYGQDSASYASNLARLPDDVRAGMPATVKDLTLGQVQAIYRAIYWDSVRGDELPPPLALLVFDAAVNNGPDRAARWLQAAVDAGIDGQIGAATLRAVQASAAKQGGAAICAEFMTQRLVFMASLPTWRSFGLGWARRLCALPYQAVTMTSRDASATA